MAFDAHSTHWLLSAVLALHLLHHRLAKRHVSFAEFGAAAVLCVPLSVPLPSWLFMTVHLALVALQVVGSLWIRRLSPDWALPSA